MKLLFASFLLLGAQITFAMPCDAGYTCTSATYKVEVQRCREINRLGSITVEKNKKEVKKIKLGSSWDGDTVLALQVHLPSAADTSRVLDIEFNKVSKAGIITEKKNDDLGAPYNVIKSETVSCKTDEESEDSSIDVDQNGKTLSDYLEGA